MPRITEESTREGGREAPEAPSPESPDVATSRNSSGNASPAAQMLELRRKLIIIARCVLDLELLSSNKAPFEELRREVQKGFRHGR